MAETVTNRLRHAWNAFKNRDPPNYNYVEMGLTSSNNPIRPRLTKGNERSIVSSVINKIAIDCAGVIIEHVQLDEDGRYLGPINSGLNNCLTLSANKDQTGRAFVQDMVMSLLDEGCIAVVPVDTTYDPDKTGSYDIKTVRVGKVVQWWPNHVRIRLYNDRVGQQQEITLPKRTVSIVENPLYSVMNEPNSTVQRLIRKLNLLDSIDEQSGSGKLDIIIGLPYAIKTEARKKQAEDRRKDMEMQLSGSKYGIAYTDGTEHITQLNRPVENNLMTQVKYLTETFYSQLGITKEIMDGTADEKTMNNYYSRTIEPILGAIVDEFKRTFLTKTARSQGQSIMCFREPFKLVPVSELANVADKFTRNEILSSNEVRQIIGFKPSKDPKADELRNKNINVGNDQTFAKTSNAGQVDADE
jgi:hypothetical protein